MEKKGLDVTIVKIEDIMFKMWGVSVTRNQVQPARLKALKWIDAEYDDQFKRLRDYGNEIMVSNPGSSVEVQSYKNGEGEDVFSRFYVCFDVLRRSWKENCGPLIGIDGAFLKSKVKGQLLVAMGGDGDNKIYLVAWGVVEKENTENWVWFVKKLQEDLGLGDGQGYIIVSDHQKGLISSVSSELSGVEHIHCIRHIYANLKSNSGQRDPMKKFIWELAWSYNEVEYRAKLKDVKNFNQEVYDYVIKSDPRSWCRDFYHLGPCCDDVENNFTEFWNRTISKAREEPFVPMLEPIRSQAKSRINKKNLEIERYEGNLTPYATEKLELEDAQAKECKIKASTGSWLLMTVLMNGFHTETWMRIYEVGITPPRGAAFWPRGSHPPVHYPPNSEKILSKDKKRKRGKNESPKNKRPKEERRIMHYGVCGQACHNSSGTKEEKRRKKEERSRRKEQRRRAKEQRRREKKDQRRREKNDQRMRANDQRRSNQQTSRAKKERRNK